MWLLVLESYVFLLVAFAMGAGVGVLGVRLVVRRTLPDDARVVTTSAQDKEAPA